MISPSSIDDAITAAATGLMAEDPSPALRARVLMQLDARPARARSWATPALALASVFVAVVVAVSLPTRFVLPEVPRVALSTGTAPAELAAPAVERLALAPVGDAERPATVEPTPAELDWHAAALPPLQTPEDLAVARSQPEPVDIPLLEVRALDAPTVGVAPLEVRRGPFNR